MIKVGITGQAGFMGSHLFNYLGTKEKIELINFERSFFESKEKIENFVSQCDVICHIAAMNRHDDEQVIYNTNIKLVEQLITACKSLNVTPKIIFSSSTQEERDNLYGKSKRDGRMALENWAAKTGAKISTLVIPNVFGPFGKPYYNSFIATFCYQIVSGEMPTVHNDGEVNLIYINELTEAFYQEIITNNKQVNTKVVSHTSTKKVSEILKLLNNYKSTYMDNGVVADLRNPFELALFNTFTSFIPKNYFPRKFVKHTDNRGAFVEIMRANTSGQSSYSTTVPGITRGNHYHTRKVERFAVISGKARIQLRKINTDQVFSYTLEGGEPAYVDMPIWYTHNITNIGDTELITLFWINEPYNQEDPDTYFVEV
ncbi:NAD-dependent epimerase/dehydratase family protein [Olleya sp. HaHaR_3_96]|uniref:polysaccharide biosynthesis C-terminal domain-containing protein n=1 Tax=Olleya sp. HaHaR_3_96 TaxID=2745560 RepID=UPI001C4E5E36|nr:NAD-dependent epimerase/dehydratase family protein [Olleya sp. HaHaR_3_96]QXP61872.1 SDR family oxidoreductase [Olleya sp. HaHaR_3_96]